MKYRLMLLAMLTGFLAGVHLVCCLGGMIETTWGLSSVAEVEWMLWFVMAVLIVLCIIRIRMLKRQDDGGMDTKTLVLIAVVTCILSCVINFTVMMDIKRTYHLFRTESPF